MQETARRRRASIPDPEEIPLTFQVGIVGTDGVLLASDRGYTNYHDGGFRTTSRSSKVLYTTGDFACCASGDQCASDAATLCQADCFCPLPIHERLYSASSAALEQCEDLGEDAARCHGEVIAAERSEGKVRLWIMQVRSVLKKPIMIPSSPTIVDRYRWTGDIGNSAVFFLERYLRYGFATSLENLKLVAAHAVLVAGQLNPSGVQGLDILLCRNGTEDFERVTDEELARLKDRSDALDSTIAATLGLPLS